MRSLHITLAFFALLLSVTPLFAEANANIVGEEVTYSSKKTTFKGYVAYDSSKTGRRPIVLVVPEWWGNNDYPRMRARMLAELGYLAMAVDMYGDGKLAEDPKTAQELSSPFYKNAALGKERIEAAITFINKHRLANPKKIAAVGYCFGGSMALNAALLGSNLSAAVSFHGGLKTPQAKRDAVRAKLLVCHGGADSFVPEADVAAFRRNMATAGLPYKFIVYQQATHAFTNPAATETGKKFDLPIQYNENADKKSWNDMKRFLEDSFKDAKM
ncbi:MAG: dienelactone hydrolase family protein [Taibaiella sp.]|nr:dienelactone hydrolase family protein [Taibaiella sp.]